MKTYIELTKTDAEKQLDGIYKYMPTYIELDGKMVRVVAQQGNNVFYVK